MNKNKYINTNYWGEGMERKVYRYCGIGDSLTVGVGSILFTKGFITRYLYLTGKVLKAPILPSTFGKIGATTGDILDSLNNKFVAKEIEEADIITITAGGNDLIDAAENFAEDKNEDDFFIALESGKRNLKNIIHRIMEIKQKQDPYIVRMMNLYNPFPELMVADKWVEAFNHNIERLKKPPIIKVADIHDLFLNREKELLFFDHIHPNYKGYAIIADALSRLGYEPLIRS